MKSINRRPLCPPNLLHKLPCHKNYINTALHHTDNQAAHSQQQSVVTLEESYPAAYQHMLIPHQLSQMFKFLLLGTGTTNTFCQSSNTLQTLLNRPKRCWTTKTQHLRNLPSSNSPCPKALVGKYYGLLSCYSLYIN